MHVRIVHRPCNLATYTECNFREIPHNVHKNGAGSKPRFTRCVPMVILLIVYMQVMQLASGYC